MSEPLRVLSLGAGVQSTTLLLLALEGELPRPDLVVFDQSSRETAIIEHPNRVPPAVLPTLRGPAPKREAPMQSQSTPVCWLPVQGWPYEVSDRGDVRRATAAQATQAGRVLKPRLFRNGYFYVCLSDKARRRWIQVHRLVADAFVHGSTPDAHVNHKDGIKHHNSADNLEWVSGTENARHALRLGLTEIGERHYAAILDVDAVREIRRLAGTVPQRTLARRYGVSRSAIVHILSGKNWKSV